MKLKSDIKNLTTITSLSYGDVFRLADKVNSDTYMRISPEDSEASKVCAVNIVNLSLIHI